MDISKRIKDERPPVASSHLLVFTTLTTSLLDKMTANQQNGETEWATRTIKPDSHHIHVQFISALMHFESGMKHDSKTARITRLRCSHANDEPLLIHVGMTPGLALLMISGCCCCFSQVKYNLMSAWYILMCFNGCFNVVSVHDFLSPSIFYITPFPPVLLWC